jgi:hypothetical protein
MAETRLNSYAGASCQSAEAQSLQDFENLEGCADGDDHGTISPSQPLAT